MTSSKATDAEREAVQPALKRGDSEPARVPRLEAERPRLQSGDSERAGLERDFRARLSVGPISSLDADEPSASASPARSESAAHRALKALAAEWAARHRLTLYAAEVRLPRSAYRADLAACTPRIASSQAFTAVFECKASRSDFLRDAAPEAATAAELNELIQRLAELRALIAGHRPDLRRGEELFPAFDCWDLRGLRHATHGRLTRRICAAQRKLLEGTKFAKLTRWRSASLLYAVTEPGVLHRWELPDGWGWLERSEDGLLLRTKPCLQVTTAAERIALLERIAAVTAVREARRLGVRRPEWTQSHPSA